MAEQLICNQQVVGSTPITSSSKHALACLFLLKTKTPFLERTEGVLKKIRISVVGSLFLGYALIILLGSALLSLPFASATGTAHAYVDCLFTSTSATCVTGLVPFDTGLGWSLFGEIVILILIQLGGLGFMTVVTLFYLMFGKRVGLHDQNILMQAQGNFSVGGIVPLIRRISIATFATEGVGTLILFLRFRHQFGAKGLYYALFTSVSAFCNAGFDVFGTGSLTAFRSDATVLLTVSLLIVVGGVGFVVLSDLFNHRCRLGRCYLHTKVVLLANAILVLGGAFLYFLLEFTDVGVKGHFSDLPLGEKLVNALFLSVSPRTAGFNAVDLAEVSGTGQFLTVLLMFLGGNPCSTAGGIKVTTAIVVLANLSAAARASKEVRIFNKSVPDSVVRQASAILLSYLLLTVGAVLVIGIFEPAGLNEILFEVVSAIATVGLTLGLTPSLSVVSKLVLIFLMYVGRLGAFSLFELFGRQRKKEYLSRQKGQILVG